MLTNQDFSVVYQTSTNFLAGQSVIATITAIQIMQDQTGVNPVVLAVFGLGSDGLPYVGFVSMSLQAEPAIPLTGFMVCNTACPRTDYTAFALENNLQF